MTKKKAKKLTKKFRFAMYSNYGDTISTKEGKLVLKPVPSYVKRCNANYDEMQIELQLIKRDLKKLAFKMKHANEFEFIQLALTHNMIWGMKLALEDYIRRINGVVKTFRLDSKVIN